MIDLCLCLRGRKPTVAQSALIIVHSFWCFCRLVNLTSVALRLWGRFPLASLKCLPNHLQSLIIFGVDLFNRTVGKHLIEVLSTSALLKVDNGGRRFCQIRLGIVRTRAWSKLIPLLYPLADSLLGQIMTKLFFGVVGAWTRYIISRLFFAL